MQGSVKVAIVVGAGPLHTTQDGVRARREAWADTQVCPYKFTLPVMFS